MTTGRVLWIIFCCVCAIIATTLAWHAFTTPANLGACYGSQLGDVLTNGTTSGTGTAAACATNHAGGTAALILAMLAAGAIILPIGGPSPLFWRIVAWWRGRLADDYDRRLRRDLTNPPAIRRVQVDRRLDDDQQNPRR